MRESQQRCVFRLVSRRTARLAHAHSRWKGFATIKAGHDAGALRLWGVACRRGDKRLPRALARWKLARLRLGHRALRVGACAKAKGARSVALAWRAWRVRHAHRAEQRVAAVLVFQGLRRACRRAQRRALARWVDRMRNHGRGVLLRFKRVFDAHARARLARTLSHWRVTAMHAAHEVRHAALEDSIEEEKRRSSDAPPPPPPPNTPPANARQISPRRRSTHAIRLSDLALHSGPRTPKGSLIEDDENGASRPKQVFPQVTEDDDEELGAMSIDSPVSGRSQPQTG